MFRLSRLLWIALLGGMIFGVYHVKGQVEEREKSLSRTLKSIEEEREAIQVLRAEWTYLNQPERLRRLARTAGEMHAPTQRQVYAQDRLGPRLAEAAPLEDSPRGIASLPETGIRSR